jgi:uncharacterized Zn finger protein (UPF0148 family)
VDTDELDVVVDSRLAKMLKASNPAPIAAPKSQKIGNILKCPNCGAQVVGGSAVCPSCGYAFMNVEVNHSAQELQQKLDELDKEYAERIRIQKEGIIGKFFVSSDRLETEKKQRKFQVISTCVVPNTRTDLMELMTMIRDRASSTGPQISETMRSEDYSLAYWMLYSNCVNKAKFSFPHDPDFASYYAFFDEEEKKGRGFLGHMKSLIKGNEGVLFALIFSIVFIIAVILFLLYAEG